MKNPNHPIRQRGARLFIGNIAVSSLAEKFGTPLYVMDEQRIRANYRRLRRAFVSRYRNTSLHYATKANPSQNVLRILRSEGCKADVSSLFEVQNAMRAGFAPSEIMFTGLNVTQEELNEVAGLGIRINLDCLSALQKISRSSKIAFASFRINPQVGAGHHPNVITGHAESKFGIWENQALAAYRAAKKAGAKRFGMHMHIGSGILTSKHHAEALAKLMDLAGKISRELGVPFEYIDIGGGLGVPYRPEEGELNADEFAERVVGIFLRKCKEHYLGSPQLRVEPGRYLVADSCVLLTRINTIKSTPLRNFAGVDAGLNVLIRPAMYGAYHHIMVDGKANLRAAKKYDVVGPVCEDGDHLGRERMLPLLTEDDLLVVLNGGAYGYSMSSQFNMRGRPAEVLVNGKKAALVRQRDALEQVIGRQKIAGWL